MMLEPTPALAMTLPAEVREKLAELELELSEGKLPTTCTQTSTVARSALYALSTRVTAIRTTALLSGFCTRVWKYASITRKKQSKESCIKLNFCLSLAGDYCSGTGHIKPDRTAFCFPNNEGSAEVFKYHTVPTPSIWSGGSVLTDAPTHPWYWYVRA